MKKISLKTIQDALSRDETKVIKGGCGGPDPFCGAAPETYGRASGCVCTQGNDCIMGKCPSGICN